ncbi:MAG: YaeQ family protein [Betaproteobacteria bacterium]|jgi:uncharacterized protein YaeQ
MAIKSTIFKANLAIADIDHSYYSDHSLTLARHPSETDERMMVRLVALAFNAYLLQKVCKGDGVMAFGAGLADPNEPDVWLKDFTDRIRLWIEVGQPEDRAIIRAGHKSDQVIVYAYHHAAEVWFKAIQSKLTRLKNLTIYRIPSEISGELSQFATRSMQLQATIQEGQLMLGDGQKTIQVYVEPWLVQKE